MLEAAKRMIFKHKNSKEPITTEYLNLLYTKLSKFKCVANLRTINVCLFGYAGFMRYSEISGLRRCDIIFYEFHLKLFIEKSKTDVYREGNWIYISRTESELCPVRNLIAYLELTKQTDKNSE